MGLAGVWARLESESKRLEEDLTRSTTANLGRIESVLKGVATQKPWLVVGCQGIGPAVRLDSGVHVLSRRTARSRTAVINHVIEGVDRARYLRLEQYRAQRSEPLSDLREPISDKKVKALLNPRGVNIATVDYDLIVELAEAICAELNAFRKGGALDVLRFLNEPFSGEGALEGFRAWLEDEHSPGSPTSRYAVPSRKWTFFVDTHRQKLLSSIEHWIRSDGPQQSMLFNVYSSSSWNGLSALAHHLSMCKWQCGGVDLPVCWIPSLTDGEGRSQLSLSYSEIVSHLLAFVRGRSATPTPAGSNRESTNAMILEIRARLAVKPALLIFQVHGDSRVGAHEMIQVIRDDHIASALIPNLLQAPTKSIKGTFDVHMWRKNRILLLSDQGVAKRGRTWFRALTTHLGLQVYSPPSVELPPPPIDTEPHILKDERHRYLDVLTRWRELAGAFDNETSEHVFRVLEAVLSLETDVPPPESMARPEWVETQASKLNRALHRRLKRHESSPDLLVAAVEVLLTRLEKRRPFWALCIRMIAITPGGLQLHTLAWLLMKASDCGNLALGETIEANWGDEAVTAVERLRRIREELESMFSALAPILAYGARDDFVGGRLDERAGWVKADRSANKQEQERVVEIAPPNVRDIVIQQLRHVPRRTFPTLELHLLLCDEAIRQHSIGLKNLEGFEQGPIRLYRRLVQALFHGLQAISLDSYGRRLEMPSIDPAALVIPAEPVALWQELLLRYYREALERPGEWRLSRLFARDQLKLELLESFTQPWRLQWSGPHSGPTMLDFLGADLTQQTRDFIVPSKHRARLALNLQAGRTKVRLSEDALFKLQKYEVQQLVLGGEHERADSKCVSMINKAVGIVEDRDRFSGLGEEVTQYAEARARQVGEYISARNFAGAGCAEGVPPGRLDALQLAPVLGELAQCLRALAPAAARRLVDGLNRWAENIATKADLARGEALGRLMSARQGRAGPGRARVSDDSLDYSSAETLRRLRDDFALAFAVYELTECLRRLIFSCHPFANKHSLSGHSTRIAIRVALHLERESARAAEEDGEGARPQHPGYFAAYAERMKDELARHLGQYVRERASILIIEATMKRILSEYDSDDVRPQQLTHALDQIERAEALLLFLSSTDRLRLRFLAERSKLLRELALVYRERALTLEDDERIEALHIARLHFGAYAHDVAALRLLSTALGLRLWEDISALQVATLESTCAAVPEFRVDDGPQIRRTREPPYVST